MNQDPDSLKNQVKEHSEKLARLGMELGKNQFKYKIEKKASKGILAMQNRRF